MIYILGDASRICLCAYATVNIGYLAGLPWLLFERTETALCSLVYLERVVHFWFCSNLLMVLHIEHCINIVSNCN